MSEALEKKDGLGKWYGIPTVLVTDEDKSDFLALLMENKGKIRPAARKAGISYLTVYNRMNLDADFKKAVKTLQVVVNDELAEELEDVSETQAKLPINTTERMFQLKALKPYKYNPHRFRGDIITNIQVNTTSKKIEDRIDPYKEYE